MSNLRADFIDYIQNHQLFQLFRDRLLIAVSGGIDSCVLVDLCHKIGLQFGIAHCNFQLRGTDADEDATFVKQWAKQLNVPYHQVAFETADLAEAQKKSIQVMARELRYQWLEQIREEEGYQYILTAHHHNDAIETLLINLAAGCGIRGLHGILPKQGTVIRPLLFAHQQAIEDYAEVQQINYREDSSNKDTKYVRNALRHLVIPPLKKLNPLLEQTFEANFERFRAAEALYDYALVDLKQKLTQQKGEQLWINIQELRKAPAPQTVLYELLKPYGFRPKLVQKIFYRWQENSGALYSSPSHQILRNRQNWIVRPLKNAAAATPKVLQTWERPEAKAGRLSLEQQTIHWEYQNRPQDWQLEPTQIYLDPEQLSWPLHCRHWQAGDQFQPFGFSGRHQKVAKYFKDKKLNRYEKEAIWLLCDAQDQIIWIVGHRLDERFRVGPNAKTILSITIQ